MKERAGVSKEDLNNAVAIITPNNVAVVPAGSNMVILDEDVFKDKISQTIASSLVNTSNELQMSLLGGETIVLRSETIVVSDPVSRFVALFAQGVQSDNTRLDLLRRCAKYFIREIKNPDLYEHSHIELPEEERKFVDGKVEDFLRANGGKAIKDSVYCCFGGFQAPASDVLTLSKYYRTAPVEEVRLGEASGLGDISGYDRGRGEVSLFEVENMQQTGKKIRLKCDRPEYFRVVAQAELNHQSLEYRAIVSGKSTSNSKLVLSSLTPVDREQPDEFHLRQAEN